MGFYTALTGLFRRPSVAPAAPTVRPTLGMDPWTYAGVYVVPIRTVAWLFAAVLYSDHGSKLIGVVTGAKDREELAAMVKARVDRGKVVSPADRADLEDFHERPAEFETL